MKRKAGSLLPLEVNILSAGIELQLKGVSEFYGFRLAKEIKVQNHTHSLAAFGTLYRALDRLEEAGLLSRRWEDPEVAEQEGRPRRRLYQVTAAGAEALAKARTQVEQRTGTMVLKGIIP